MSSTILAARVTETVQGVQVQTDLGTQTAGRWDWVIEQGRTLAIPISWYDQTEAVVDVSGYTAKLTIRLTWGSTTALVALTSAAGITLAATDPNIVISLASTTTAAYTGWTRACYDLELISAGSVTTRLLEGFVTLRKEISA